MNKNTKNLECEVCGKRSRVVYNRPNSLKRGKHKVHPNIQKKNGKTMCAQCLKKNS